MTYQIPLELTARPLKRFDNFIAGDNGWLINSLKHSRSDNGERLHYVWADVGYGKTHLLQACINYALDTGEIAVYIPLAEAHISPDVLIGLEQCQWVALDDVDKVLGNKEWEEGLFHFFNRCKDANCSVIFSASVAPIELNCHLPDLMSRFAWCQVSRIASLSDVGLIDVMMQTAEQLALPIDSELCEYILLRYSRRIDKLVDAIETLNKSSLSEKRKVTVPFIKKSLYV